MDKARARALLDQERRRLEQLGRAVSRDHDDAVAASRPEDPVNGTVHRVAEETSEALSEQLRDRWGALGRGGGSSGGGHLRGLDPERSAHSRRAAGGVPAGRADRRGGGGEDRDLILQPEIVIFMVARRLLVDNGRCGRA